MTTEIKMEEERSTISSSYLHFGDTIALFAEGKKTAGFISTLGWVCAVCVCSICV